MTERDGVIPVDRDFFKRASWGPVHIDADADRVRAWAPGSKVVTIEAPSAHDSARTAAVEALRAGVPVLYDDVPTLTLTQPQRGLGHRADRVVRVAGAGIPEGLVLRARWVNGVGLETPDQRLIRPRCDLVEMPYLGLSVTPRIDPSVSPELVALWGAAWWHLIGVLHR